MRWKNPGPSAVAAVAVAIAGQAHAAWIYKSQTDPLTDERISTASGWDSRTRALAVVRCTAGDLEMFVAGDDFVDTGGADVRWRFDKRPADGDYWNTSTAGNGVFAPYPDAMAREMAKASSMIFEIEDFRGTPQLYSFSMAGSGAAISRVLSDCGQPLTGPWTADRSIAPEVIDTLFLVRPSELKIVQGGLNELGVASVREDGQRDLATYQAASRLWQEYWGNCERGDLLTLACDEWRRTGKPDVKPRSVVGLIAELLADKTPKRPLLRSAFPDPKWQYRPNEEDLAFFRPEWAPDGGEVELECSVGEAGVLYHCKVLAGELGQAAIFAAELWRRKEPGISPADKERITVSFPPKSSSSPSRTGG